MIAALRELAEAHGPDVSVARFCRESGLSNSHIYRYFENWADLREQAGLPAFVDRTRIHARHTEESLIEALRAVVQEVGEDVSLKDSQYHTGISPHPIYRLFGRWQAFKEAAGLPRQRKPGLPARHDEQSLLERLREFVKERGSDVTLYDFCRETGISPDTVYWYGSWRQLRRKLGLTDCGRRPTWDPDDPNAHLIANLWDPAELLDPPPLW
jgi:AcrR family transcriptional regulator